MTMQADFGNMQTEKGQHYKNATEIITDGNNRVLYLVVCCVSIIRALLKALGSKKGHRAIGERKQD